MIRTMVYHRLTTGSDLGLCIDMISLSRSQRLAAMGVLVDADLEFSVLSSSNRKKLLAWAVPTYQANNPLAVHRLMDEWNSTFSAALLAKDGPAPTAPLSEESQYPQQVLEKALWVWRSYVSPSDCIILGHPTTVTGHLEVAVLDLSNREMWVVRLDSLSESAKVRPVEQIDVMGNLSDMDDQVLKAVSSSWGGR